MEMSRRDLLKLGVFGSAAVLLPVERVARTKLLEANRIAASRLPQPFAATFQRPPVLAKKGMSAAGEEVYDIVQQSASVEILGSGIKTEIWGYNGIAPGPTIAVNQGTPALVRQSNLLPDKHPTLRYTPWTSTHLHGSASLPQYDGYASDVTNPHEFKDYQYPNFQPARTLWYHDHGVHITAPNAYMGLAAMYILHDRQEVGLVEQGMLPGGEYDVPLIIKDAMFTSSGQLIFDDNSQSSLFGDVILVNGKPWPLMQVEPFMYRFRLLNASISRSYNLSLDTGDDLIVIGTDGGLMPAPQRVKSIRHGMAERYEVVIDFSKYAPRTPNAPRKRIVLKNGRLPNNQDFDTTGNVMAFEVVPAGTLRQPPGITTAPPPTLNPDNEIMKLTPNQAVRTRLMEFKRDGGQWTVNGRTWEDVINSNFTQVVAHPALGDVEIWDLKNSSGGWFHPVHIHLVDFKILSRNGQPPRPYEQGPKDVAYVGEGETVRVITRFGDSQGRQRGKYMMHCHNLVHEDHDMMVQFEVGEGGDDPLGTKAQPLPPQPPPA